MQEPEVAPILLKGASSDLVVAGYASVEMVDKQGDLITRGALKDAFKKFMSTPGYRNVQLAHSNIQVGEVIPDYTDTSGRVWKSEVDDTGMFVVIRLRDDIEKAREVASEVRKGNLRSFSIGGQAFERVSKNDSERGDYREIRRMELHEVTICEKGINPEAQFRILKEDPNGGKESMTDAMQELHSVLERLSKRLEEEEPAVEKGEEAPTNVAPAVAEETIERGELPDALKDAKKNAKESDDDDDDDDKVDKSAMDDVITTDYLQWLESTVKSAGYDPTSAREHFDGVAKGYGPGDHGYDHRGQGSIEGAGEDDSSKRPKLNFGSAPSGNKYVIKATETLDPSSVTSSQIEEAYEVYKKAALAQQFRADIGNEFSMRLQKEMEAESSEKARAAYDAREPLAQLEKAVSDLSERIENISAGGETITKADGAAPAMTIPDTSEFAQMSWDDVHRLAGKALTGGGN